jgi:hypothetical protein
MLTAVDKDVEDHLEITLDSLLVTSSHASLYDVSLSSILVEHEVAYEGPPYSKVSSINYLSFKLFVGLVARV